MLNEKESFTKVLFSKSRGILGVLAASGVFNVLGLNLFGHAKYSLAGSVDGKFEHFENIWEYSGIMLFILSFYQWF